MKRNTCDLLSRSKSVSTLCFHNILLFGFYYSAIIIRLMRSLWLTFSSPTIYSLLTSKALFVSVAWLTFDGSFLSASLYALPFISISLLACYLTPWFGDACRNYMIKIWNWRHLGLVYQIFWLSPKGQIELNITRCFNQAHSESLCTRWIMQMLDRCGITFRNFLPGVCLYSLSSFKVF